MTRKAIHWMKSLVLGVLTVCLISFIPAIWFVWSRGGILWVMVVGTAAVLIYPQLHNLWVSDADAAGLDDREHRQVRAS